MPWMNDEYLVDTRERTLTPLTPELRDELGRIRSSTRRVVKAVSGDFERLVRDGYRVVERAGEGLFRNPEYTEGPQNWDLRHVHYNSGSEVQATAKLLKKAGYKAEIQVNKGYGYGIYKVAKSWTLMTDAPNDVVFILDKFLKRQLTDWEERQFPEYYKLLSERLGYDLRDKQDQTAGEVGRGGVVKGKALNPHYNVLTKAQFDALRQINKAYPKGDVFLGEIKLKPGERFSDALVAVERLSRATGIDHDVVQYKGKYYSAPTEWVERVVVDARMEARGSRGSRSISEHRGGGGGGFRGAVKAGWRELMKNPDPHDPIVIDNYLKVRRGAVFHGSPDNVVNRYRLSDGRTVTVSGEGWYVSAGASYPEQSGKGVHSLNDWLANEPARMKARAEAGVLEARKAKERKAEASKERSIKAFIEKLRAGIEKATGKGEVFYTGPERITPQAIVKGDGVEVTVELNTGRYFAYGIGHGFQPAKLFKYLAKYGDWEP